MQIFRRKTVSLFEETKEDGHVVQWGNFEARYFLFFILAKRIKYFRPREYAVSLTKNNHIIYSSGLETSQFFHIYHSSTFKT